MRPLTPSGLTTQPSGMLSDGEGTSSGGPGGSKRFEAAAASLSLSLPRLIKIPFAQHVVRVFHAVRDLGNVNRTAGGEVSLSRAIELPDRFRVLVVLLPQAHAADFGGK